MQKMSRRVRPQFIQAPACALTFALFAGAAGCRLPFGGKSSNTDNRPTGGTAMRRRDFGREPDSSRREVLRWLAMAGASSLLPASKALARAGMPPAAVSAGRIDVHTHTVPPFYTKIM